MDPSKQKILLAVILFLLGLSGIFTLLSMEFPLDSFPVEVQETLLQQFTLQQLRLLQLINPLILLIIAVFIGTLLHDKVKLGAPTIENIIRENSAVGVFTGQLKSGVAGGILAGILLVLVSLLFQPFFPPEFIEYGQQNAPAPLMRFLYGGITEEILMRFGLMTLFVWIGSKITGKLSEKVYWIGIVLAALLFAVGHFPMLFQVISDPPLILMVYVMLGNTIGGIIFGWLYWKKGLEAAFIAHIFAHVVMIIGEQIFN